MGAFMNPDPTRIITKRIILTGHPLKVHKKTATIRYMFFNSGVFFQYFRIAFVTPSLQMTSNTSSRFNFTRNMEELDTSRNRSVHTDTSRPTSMDPSHRWTLSACPSTRESSPNGRLCGKRTIQRPRRRCGPWRSEEEHAHRHQRDQIRRPRIRKHVIYPASTCGICTTVSMPVVPYIDLRSLSDV